jgi:hypothetical protein
MGRPITSSAIYGLFETSDSSTVFEIPNAFILNSMSINSPGVVVVWIDDVTLVSHSFRRTPDGTLTSIDFPGAGTGFIQGTRRDSNKPCSHFLE